VSPTCAICGGSSALLHAGTTEALTAAAFSPTCHEPGLHGDLWRCARCGTVMQPSLPAGGRLLDLYRGTDDAAYLAEEAGRRATARRLLGLAERHAAPGRLLDVGCGHGLLLDEARRRGWAVLGLELSAAAAAHARALGLEVRDTTLDQLEEGPFDTVVLADVLEHLDDPVGAVRAAASRLRDGGVLLVVTPDPGSATARVAGARWWGFLPAHTYLLPRRTLRAVLAGEGLEPISDRGLRRTFTLRYWLEGLGQRSRAAARALASLERLPLARLPVTLSLGDERVVLARKGIAA
jgi:SAM-dependent methyltransferase